MNIRDIFASAQGLNSGSVRGINQGTATQESLSDRMSASFQEFLDKTHAADRAVKGYTLGQQDITQVATLVSHLAVEIEATKSITEAAVNAYKSILNTNL
jgi:flagellar hook-basal body complex protein FliE